MTIPLTGAEGLFTRLGAIGRTYNKIRTDVGDSAGNIGDLADAIFAEYVSTQTDLPDGLFDALAAYRGSPSSFFSYLVGLASETLISMVEADTPQPNASLANALAYLVRQMVADGDSVERPTLSLGSVTAGAGNVGDGDLVAIALAPDGSVQPYLFEEDVVFLCSQDGGTGGTQYAEVFNVSAPASKDRAAWDWPKGSGASGQLASVNPRTTGANLLTSSAFDSFTVADTPNDWTIDVGAAGDDILAGGSAASYDGINCLRFIEFAGAPLTAISQAVTLSPLSAYALSFMAKRSSGLSGAGTLRVALVDVDGTVLTDPQGNPCSTSYTLSGWTTSFVRKTATFYTPRILPSGVWVEFKLTTAIADAGESIYLDWAALTAYTRLYDGGPGVALFSGITSWQVGDILTLPVNNNYAGAMLLWLDRAWGLRESGVVIPTDASPTIPDTLIT